MISPDELIGQKVWLKIERHPYYYGEEPLRVKAEITQPTSPPWFYLRYLDAPASVAESGRWMTLYEVQQAFLIDPVFEYDEEADFAFSEESNSDDFSESNFNHS